MADQFQEQGGAATMDPNASLRWATSKLMTHLCRPKRQAKQRAEAEKERIKTGGRHVVEYFHQVEDGYSHLAAQVLASLAQRYDIELVCHLVPGPQGKNAAEPELLLKLSRYDAFHVAPEYGLEFPRHDGELLQELVKLARGILAAQEPLDFVARAAAVGRALWADEGEALKDLAAQWGCAKDSDSNVRVAVGTERREELKHYSGAMFYYAGSYRRG